MGRQEMRRDGIRGDQGDEDQRGSVEISWDRLGSVGEAAAKGDVSIRIRVSRLSKKTRFLAKNKT